MSVMRGNEILNEHKSLFTFAAGAFVQWNLDQQFSIRVPLLFERKGSKVENEALLSGQEVMIRYTYLTLPVLFRLNVGDKKLRYFLNAGPYLAYLIDYGMFSEGEPVSDNFTTTKSFKKFDAGISGGMGVSLPIKAHFTLSLEIRNNLGLMNISDLPVYGDGSIKTNVTQLLLGVSYKIP